MTTQEQGFPQINAPMVDPVTGRATQAWFRLFTSLWMRTGGSSGTSAYDPTDVAITGGTIDNTVIGENTPAAGRFTTLRATTSVTAPNLTGINTGDVTLTGEDYLTIANQALIANSVNLGNTNVTGTLAAARFGALTGDVTNTAGSYATTIATHAVSYEKMQQASTVTLLGNPTGSTADISEITLGAGLNFSGTTLVSTGLGGTVTTTGTPASGQVSIFSGSTAITGSASLLFDASTSVLTNALSASSTAYSTWTDAATATTFTKVSAGNALLDFVPNPTNGTGTGSVRLFRTTNTTGTTSLQIFLGNNSATTNALLGGQGLASYVCANNGNFLVGTSTDDSSNKLQVNGGVTINSATMIRTNTSFTNGAGAAAGTLANAPTAGNPTKWIPINDNGTTRYIPAW